MSLDWLLPEDDKRLEGDIALGGIKEEIDDVPPIPQLESDKEESIDIQPITPLEEEVKEEKWFKILIPNKLLTRHLVLLAQNQNQQNQKLFVLIYLKMLKTIWSIKFILS